MFNRGSWQTNTELAVESMDSVVLVSILPESVCGYESETNSSKTGQTFEIINQW